MPTNDVQAAYESEQFSRTLEAFINNHYRQIAYFAYENRLMTGRGVVWLRLDGLTADNTVPHSGLLPLSYVAVHDKQVQDLSSDVPTKINEYDLDEQGILCIQDQEGVSMVPIGLARFTATIQVYLEDSSPDQEQLN